MSTLPAVVCAGGSGPERVHATLASAAGDHALCVTSSIEEDGAAAGLARVLRLEPWPGPHRALEQAVDEVAGEPVALLASGTTLRRNALRRAGELLGRGTAVVVLAETRRKARALQRRIRLYPRATFQPGSGVVLSAEAAPVLRERGWLQPDATLTVADIEAIAGPIRVLGAAIHPAPPRALEHMTVTVLIPAYNEEAWIGDTLRSLEQQTRRPDRVVVVDDGSTDRTGVIAAALGARVLRPPRKQGQKATALNYGLAHIDTDAVIVLDADTLFHPEAVEHLMVELERGTDATCGAVLPMNERGIWARGRAIEYSVAMRIHKRIQRGLGSVFVLSGCISAFRTEALRTIGGFSERTITDDVDATWSLLTRRFSVSYTPEAISYTVEPPNWQIYKAQMRRWAGALFQTLPYHVKRLHKKPSLALVVGAAMWDVVTVPIFFVSTAVMIATGHARASAMIGLWAAAAMTVTLVASISVIGVRRTLKSFPASLLMLWTNLYFFFEALVREWVLRRRSLAWVKGH
ncbi:MAG TPA: glycosyltransferase family 2 protein [Actinomycetota bacterium]|nr:glycosyltransferase family 2 protein [Actinomycetota bacterium]